MHRRIVVMGGLPVQRGDPFDAGAVSHALGRPEHAAEPSALFSTDAVAVGSADTRAVSGANRQPEPRPIGPSTVCDAAAEPATDGHALGRPELGSFDEAQHGTIAASQRNTHTDTFSLADSNADG